MSRFIIAEISHCSSPSASPPAQTAQSFLLRSYRVSPIKFYPIKKRKKFLISLYGVQQQDPTPSHSLRGNGRGKSNKVHIQKVSSIRPLSVFWPLLTCGKALRCCHGNVSNCASQVHLYCISALCFIIQDYPCWNVSAASCVFVFLSLCVCVCDCVLVRSHLGGNNTEVFDTRACRHESSAISESMSATIRTHYQLDNNDDDYDEPSGKSQSSPAWREKLSWPPLSHIYSKLNNWCFIRQNGRDSFVWPPAVRYFLSQGSGDLKVAKRIKDYRKDCNIS